MWQTEMVRLLRHMINDLGTPPTYDDERLQELIIVSAQFVSSDVVLTTAYTTDIDHLLLTPDPTEGVKDNGFINLVTLKAACIVDSSEVRKAAGQAITIRDGSSMISLGGTGGMLDGRLKIWQEGWCKAYKETKLQYERGLTGSAGAAILGPFRVWSGFYPEGGRYR